MSEQWIIPCNIRFFDVIEHFKNNREVIWYRRGAFNVNDIVYIYVGNPIMELKFKCHVVDADVAEDIVKANSYAIRRSNTVGRLKYMKLVLDEEFPNGTFPYKTLKEHSLGQVQIPQRADRRLKAYIADVLNK